MGHTNSSYCHYKLSHTRHLAKELFTKRCWNCMLYQQYMMYQIWLFSWMVNLSTSSQKNERFLLCRINEVILFSANSPLFKYNFVRKKVDSEIGVKESKHFAFFKLNMNFFKLNMKYTKLCWRGLTVTLISFVSFMKGLWRFIN